MAKYKPESIRSVAIVGHAGTGKTTLVDEILFLGKANNRIGSVKDGTSLSDFAEDEIEAKASIDMGLLFCNYDGIHFQLLDAPGRSAFIGQTIQAIAAADVAVVMVDGYTGLQVDTKKAWELAKSMNKPVAIVLSKVDMENVDLEKVISEIQNTFGSHCVPFYLADGVGSALTEVQSVMNPPANATDLVKSFHEPLTESIVESDEELMMRYLDGEDVSSELSAMVGSAVRAGSLVPIICHGSKGTTGAAELLGVIKDFFPSPAETTKVMIDDDGTVEEKDLVQDELLAQVVKVIIDEHKGKMAVMKIMSGQAVAGGNFFNITTGKSGRFSKLVKICGTRHDEIDNVGQGEIVAAVKLDELKLGDCISGGKWKDALVQTKFPVPMVALAVRPKTHADEQKISVVLAKFASEDPTFRTEIDRQTKEMLIYGMAELHLNVILKRMEKKHKVAVTTKLPRISYRETITRTVSDFYRHKKQSGGSGEFAEVHFHMRPFEGEGDFNFVDGLKGDGVRRQFVPSVEKGCRAVMDSGILTGSPIINVEVEFFDGKDHPVDGKDSAFQKAARECFKKCFLAAGPSVLEPMVSMEVVFPAEFAGELNQFINAHRGRIAGMDSAGSDQILRCTIPLAEVQTFSTDLRSMTQGQGSYTIAPSGFEQVPPNVQAQVIERYKADAVEAD